MRPLRVAIIGGGAVGAACALFLRRLGGDAVQVQVIEPDAGLRLASSARSAASIRQQFSNAVNVQMSRFGWQVLSDPGPWLAVDGQVPDLGLVRSGYLFLAGSAAGAQTLRNNHALQAAAGATVDLLPPAELASALPWLSCGDVQLASLGRCSDRAGEGWFDGEAFARALGRAARHHGARWVDGRVAAAQRQGARLQALLLDDGRRIEADAVVLAAGAWSGAVGRRLGLEVPVVARHRTVFSLRCPTPIPGPTPLVVDAGGVWWRSEGAGFIAGWSPGAGDADPDDDTERPQLDQPALQQFEERLWPALAARVPAFEALRVASAWDGWYEVHPADHNALIGPHPHCANLLLACGFSGHGLQHAPAAGRGIAEWLLQGRWASLDLSQLGAERIASGRRFVEQAVI
ncbi:MAG: FAD-binding oxidoreductase [Burkholderiaceae bacterium]|nr:FAD-binding oxidoreductase [Burkholderiaceae bacterium]